MKVFLRTHTGKHIDVEGSKPRARWDDHGDWQKITIEKEGAAGTPLRSGDTVFLRTRTGKHIDVEGDTVRARWDDHGDWQKFVIEKEGGGTIGPGDTIFLRSHTGKHIDVEGDTVRARWDDRSGWQKFVLEVTPGNPPSPARSPPAARHSTLPVPGMYPAVVPQSLALRHTLPGTLLEYCACTRPAYPAYAPYPAQYIACTLPCLRFGMYPARVLCLYPASTRPACAACTSHATVTRLTA